MVTEYRRLRNEQMGETKNLPYCQVIVDILHDDLDRVFTYRVPSGLKLSPGMRVTVPFGHRQGVEGLVLRITEESGFPEDRVKSVQKAMEAYPIIKPALLELAEHIKKTSYCSMAQALRLMYPAEMRKNRIAEKKTEWITLVIEEQVYDTAIAEQKRSWKRQAVLKALMEAPEHTMSYSAIRAIIGGDCRGCVSALIKAGVVRSLFTSAYRTPYVPTVMGCTTGPDLTIEQEAVVKELLPAIQEGKGSYLLFGVTGSGKTEVYIRAVQETMSAGQAAIVLVPEIALTPQMVAWFRARFGSHAAVLHSGLSAGERYDEWRRIYSGEATVVVGARSAVFAPISNLGLIIVDEEHEQTYCSDRTPMYDARAVAKYRCEREGAVLLLASATPSLRSFAMAERGDLKLLEMTRRVHDLPLPKVHIIDMRKELQAGNRSVFSASLVNGLCSCIAKGDQAILFVNRRGYSSFVSCRSCGYVVTCSHCDVSMTYHISDGKLHCHYCGEEALPPQICPECGSRYIRYFGIGTQRVEEEIHRLIPHAKTARMDNDTTRKKDAHAKILEAFRKKETQILIGTQMISKGLDFPDVTLVGIVSADATLNLPDYRAQERTFQLLTQVSGRAGRSHSPGEVFLQTYNPSDPTICAASRQDYRSFYTEEMQRRKTALYPPYTLIARLVWSGAEETTVRGYAVANYELLKSFIEKREFLRKYLIALRVMACPIKRIQDKMRWEVVVKTIDQPIAGDILVFMSELASTTYENGECIFEINPRSMV